MHYINLESMDHTAVGIACGPNTHTFLDRCPDVVEYVEVAFEQLKHGSNAASLQSKVPLILHCASMSLAGFVSPDETTLKEIEVWTAQTGTPWIGEHLAFLIADPLNLDGQSMSPTVLTYTVCPQLSEQTLVRAVENLNSLQHRFTVPILLENPPQYFKIPGSTMTLVDFINELSARCEARFILDITHFLITAKNMGFDAFREIDRLPLERVDEIHLSGISMSSGLAWDDHASPASEQSFALLRQSLERARPRAVTLEYNATPDFSDDVLVEDIARVREILS